MRRQGLLALAAMIILGIAASTITWYCTTWGTWAGSDSAVYITAARNYIAGIGLRVIQPSGKSATLLGPAYPLLLAGLGMMKIPLLDAARWINIFLFGTTTFLTGFSFYKMSHSPWLSLPVSIMVMFFPTMVDLHSGMMTEPLYLWTALLGLSLLLTYLDHNSRFYLAGAAIFSGIAVITRFIGFSLLPVGVFALLFLQRTAWKRRLVDAGLFTLISLIPFIAWYTWFQYNPDTSSPLGMPQWSNPFEYLKLMRDGMVNTIWGWVPFHAYIPFGLKIEKYLSLFIMGLALISMPVWGAVKLYGKQLKRWISDKDVKMFAVFGIYSIGYLITFIFIYLFRTPAQDVNDRTLLPLYQPVVMMLFTGFSLLSRAVVAPPKVFFLKTLPWLALAVGMAAYLPESMALAAQYHESGAGYSSAAWRNSETLKAVEQLPADITLISNNTGVIMFYTGRSSLEIEELFRSEPLAEYTRFGDNPNSPNEVLFRDSGAALILWEPSFYWQLYGLYQDKTNERIDALVNGLTLYGQYSDGAIYFYPAQK